MNEFKLCSRCIVTSQAGCHPPGAAHDATCDLRIVLTRWAWTRCGCGAVAPANIEPMGPMRSNAAHGDFVRGPRLRRPGDCSDVRFRAVPPTSTTSRLKSSPGKSSAGRGTWIGKNVR